jgi:hypothetical protein
MSSSCSPSSVFNHIRVLFQIEYPDGSCLHAPNTLVESTTSAPVNVKDSFVGGVNSLTIKGAGSPITLAGSSVATPAFIVSLNKPVQICSSAQKSVQLSLRNCVFFSMQKPAADFEDTHIIDWTNVVMIQLSVDATRRICGTMIHRCAKPGDLNDPYCVGIARPIDLDGVFFSRSVQVMHPACINAPFVSADEASVDTHPACIMPTKKV